MNAIETLAATLRRRLPRASLELIRPRDPEGRWTLDVELDAWLAVVVWVPLRGFAITVGPVDADQAIYGESPEEAYPGSAEALAEHVVELLKGRRRTSPPRSVALKELRARCGLSQADVASRLGIRQGTVSKIERSEGLDVSKLAALVRAMGGELELWVRFPDDAPIRLVPPAAAPRTKRRPR